MSNDGASDRDTLPAGGSFEDLKAIAAMTDGKALLEAAAAWRRDELTPSYAATLFQAVALSRGAYITALMSEANAYLKAHGGDDAGLSEHIAGQRERHRALFRRDLEAVIAEARGG